MENVSATTEMKVSEEHTLYAEPIFNIGHFEVTNSLLTSWVALIILVTLSID